MRIIDADSLARKLDDMIREGEELAKKARDFKYDMATIGGLSQARKMIDIEPTAEVICDLYVGGVGGRYYKAPNSIEEVITGGEKDEAN